MGEYIESEFWDACDQILALARARLAREHAPISTVTLAHEVDILGVSA